MADSTSVGNGLSPVTLPEARKRPAHRAAFAALSFLSIAACSGHVEDNYGKSVVVAKSKLIEMLKDPSSAQFQNVLAFPFVTNDGTQVFYFCGEVNSKNGFGGYAGYQRFIATIEGAVVETDPSFQIGWSQRCSGTSRDAIGF